MTVLLGTVGLSLYSSMLVAFGFVSHPLGYCLLLVGGALSLSFVSICVMGLSWYLALFILVYVGGVYVLFLFISVHSANSFPVVGGSPILYFILFTLFYLIFYLSTSSCSVIEENSRFLCSGMEGLGYLVLCFVLLVGFVGVSIISSHKDSFFR